MTIDLIRAITVYNAFFRIILRAVIFLIISLKMEMYTKCTLIEILNHYYAFESVIWR